MTYPQNDAATKTSRVSRLISPALTALALIWPGSPLLAQDYPSKPVTMVLPYAAGGGSDLIGRMFAQKMTQVLNQTVLAENRPGAAGLIALQYVARAPKDGHIVMLASSTGLVSNPHLFKSAGYRIEDFDAISMVRKGPFIISIRNEMPAQDVKGFVAFAKTRPGKLTFGTIGLGSSTHLLGEMMNDALGIKTTDIPYKGAAPALTDLIAGRIDTYADTIVGALPSFRAGKHRIIAITGDKRSPLLPEVPTFLELGYPDMVSYSLHGLVGPAGMRKVAIEKLHSATVRSLSSEDLRERMIKDGSDPVSSTPEEFSRFIRVEYERMGKIISRLGIQLTEAN
jgi:tripartite-type tricarboxylate transporter receptor subunit TctC